MPTSWLWCKRLSLRSKDPGFKSACGKHCRVKPLRRSATFSTTEDADSFIFMDSFRVKIECENPQLIEERQMIRLFGGDFGLEVILNHFFTTRPAIIVMVFVLKWQDMDGAHMWFPLAIKLEKKFNISICQS